MTPRSSWMLLTLAVLSSGCLVNPARVEPERSAVRREQARYGDVQYAAAASMLDRSIALTCKPQNHAASCGLIHDEVFEPGATRRFVRETCDEPEVATLDDASEDCRRRHRRMFFARLEERYVEVSPKALRTHCDAYPHVCAKPRKLETWLLRTHNANVRADYQQELRHARLDHHDRLVTAKERDAAATRERQKRADERYNAWMTLLDAVVDEDADHCVSRDVGGGVQTTSCR